MTQNERILKYLNDFGSISTIEAFSELGITRLASRIHEIQKIGIVINRHMVKAQNRYGEPVSYMRYTLGV